MYSFGVVLVELLTGSRSTKKVVGFSVGEWAEKYLNNRFRLRGIMDSRLEGKYVTGQASEIAMLALRCLVRNPKFRPSMKEVAETLEKIKTRAYNQKHLVMVCIVYLLGLPYWIFLKTLYVHIRTFK